jgi:hypothetical protein
MMFGENHRRARIHHANAGRYRRGPSWPHWRYAARRQPVTGQFRRPIECDRIVELAISVHRRTPPARRL